MKNISLNSHYDVSILCFNFFFFNLYANLAYLQIQNSFVLHNLFLTCIAHTVCMDNCHCKSFTCCEIVFFSMNVFNYSFILISSKIACVFSCLFFLSLLLYKMSSYKSFTCILNSVPLLNCCKKSF